MSFARTIKTKILMIIQKRRFNQNRIFLGWNSDVKRSRFIGNNKVGNDSVVVNCLVGKCSYLGNQVNFNNVKIGGFCSIGDNVKVIAAQHPTDTFISTSPLFYTQRSNLKSYVSREKFPNFKTVQESTHAVIIGNDVWIASHVLIMGGVTIGNGAIIAAGSVVVKDVAPYSIVGGVPAKHIRYRFDHDVIHILEIVRWWDKSDEWLFENAEFFSDISLFIEKAKNGKK